jgi:hypothetical protein
MAVPEDRDKRAAMEEMAVPAGPAFRALSIADRVGKTAALVAMAETAGKAVRAEGVEPEE